MLGLPRSACSTPAGVLCLFGMWYWQGWRLSSSESPLKTRVPCPRQYAGILLRHLPFPVYAWQTWRLAGLFSGKSQSFPRNCNTWKYCWLRCSEGNVQTGLASDALTCSLCPLGRMCASFLEDCFSTGEMMAKGPVGRCTEWLAG